MSASSGGLVSHAHAFSSAPSHREAREDVFFHLTSIDRTRSNISGP